MMTPTVCRAALVVALTSAACGQQGALHGTVISDPLPAPALRLVDSRGGAFDLGAQKGKTVLVYFGYTHCPDVCPATLADFARARRVLTAKQRNAMRLVFVSVDPARDTPAGTEKYVWQFDSTFVGLVPSVAQLDSIKAAWGFAVVRDSMPGMKHEEYGVSHPAGVFVVDREGRVRMVFGPATRPEDLAADLRRIL